MFGDAYSQIATLVERHTRYVMLVKLVDKDSYTVAAALARHAQTLPRELYRSLTWDRGSEMAGHKRFTVATDIQVYFCDPQNPWQRGTNENTNGLLRQYLPKGIDISGCSQIELDAIARKLNERPERPWGTEPRLSCLTNALHRSVESTTHSVTKKPKVFPLGFFVGYSPSRVLVTPPLDLR